MTAPDRWLMMYEQGGGAMRIELGDEPVLRAAMERWLASRKRADELLTLTTTAGNEYTVLVSEITGWHPSTPASRAAETELEALLKAERPTWEDA